MKTFWKQAMMAAVIAAVVSLAAVAVATAQGYPPPVGNITSTTSSTTTNIDGTVTLSSTVQDQSGGPIAGASVIFTITSQPGSDAYLSLTGGSAQQIGTSSATGSAGAGHLLGDSHATSVNAAGPTSVTATTNTQGVATAYLHAGSTAGTVVVSVTSGGKTSQVSVAVSAPSPSVPGVTLPNTGNGPGSTASGSPLGVVFAAAAAVFAVLLCCGAGVWWRRSRAHSGAEGSGRNG